MWEVQGQQQQEAVVARAVPAAGPNRVSLPLLTVGKGIDPHAT